MRVSGKKALAGLLLLGLAGWAAWWHWREPRFDGSPAVKQLLADLRGQQPWYYRFLQRTHTLRFFPRPWFARYSYPPSRLVAVFAFGWQGTNAWPAVPALIAMVEDKDQELACSAAQALAVMKAEQHPDWDQLKRDLHGQSSAARVFRWELASYPHFALIGLAATGPAAVTARGDVLDLLQHSQDMKLRSLAVTALGAMGDSTNTVPVLKAILQDPNEWPAVSGWAAEALAAAAPADPQTRPLLRLALQEHRAHVRLGAARALWKLQAPPEEVLPVLTALLHHPLASLRKDALEGLAAMGKAAAPSQAEVEPLLDDEHATVREAARLAWKRITGGALAAGQRVQKR